MVHYYFMLAAILNHIWPCAQNSLCIICGYPQLGCQYFLKLWISYNMHIWYELKWLTRFKITVKIKAIAMILSLVFFCQWKKKGLGIRVAKAARGTEIVIYFNYLKILLFLFNEKKLIIISNAFKLKKYKILINKFF